MNEQKLIDLALSLGAYQAAVIPVSRIHFDKSFRSLCESNACGNFGMCWMCPPDVGDIVKLIEEAKTFQSALAYQTVGELADGYDIEGMLEAGITGWLKKFPAHSPPSRSGKPSIWARAGAAYALCAPNAPASPAGFPTGLWLPWRLTAWRCLSWRRPAA